MYNDYFGLRESPFSIAPNPHYLFMSERHREALAHLLYGIRSDGGIILLTGEVGTGKTTVCRSLLEQLPENIDIALILNPKLTALEMLASICDELAITYPDNTSSKALIDPLNRYLLDNHEKGKRTILIIDEAQNLDTEVLEQIRLLTNLETNQRKLLQIILLGQPELLTLLDRQELRQLSQRITARFHLDALTPAEVGEYIEHRLAIAGSNSALFKPASIRRLVQISGGIPRLINLVCDRALLGAYAEGKRSVTPDIIAKAAREILGSTPAVTARTRRKRAWTLGLIIIACLGVYGLVNTGVIRLPVPAMPGLSEAVGPIRSDAPSTTAISAISDAVSERPARDTPTAVPSDNLTPLSGIQGALAPGAALDELARLWQQDLPDEPCRASASNHLRCLETEDTLAVSAAMNRPIALNLGTPLKPSWVTLARLDSESATLRAGGEAYRVNRQELAARLPVPGLLLWQAPPGYAQPLQLGDTGPAVDTLVDRLARLTTDQGKPETGYLYDLKVEAQVAGFQTRQGLDATGKVDPRTWIYLNNRLDSGPPRLFQEAHD